MSDLLLRPLSCNSCRKPAGAKTKDIDMTERRETGRSRQEKPGSRPQKTRTGAVKNSPDTARKKPGHSPKTLAEPDWSEGERIAKYLARAGVASRREVERMIEAGEVIVNGVKLTSPAFKVTGRETIKVGRKTISAPEPTRLWRYHKPSGLISTNSDPEGRRTIFDEFPKSLPRVVTVGRLDLTTEGLLLLTNDGELARALELPKNALERTYRVRAQGTVTDSGRPRNVTHLPPSHALARGPVPLDLPTGNVDPGNSNGEHHGRYRACHPTRDQNGSGPENEHGGGRDVQPDC